MTAVWVVRVADPAVAGQVKERSAVAIGWSKVGNLTHVSNREKVLELVRDAYPEDRPMRQAVQAGQLFRFAHEIEENDFVLTPFSSTRTLLIGRFRGPYVYDPAFFAPDHPQIRRVEWLKEISRDDLSVPAKNSLGGLGTVFRADGHLSEINDLVSGRVSPATSESSALEEGAVADLYSDVKAKADEAIRDLFARLGGYEFQEVVAALLRAMGYIAKSGPKGKDAGVDLLAHPDPLGFSDPRIKVQVKHRSGQASRPEVQGFSGVLHPGEHGLFVSTGGFTKDAESWASQSGKAITLLDGEGFTELFLANYEGLDPSVKAIVPLRPVWIPVSL